MNHQRLFQLGQGCQPLCGPFRFDLGLPDSTSQPDFIFALRVDADVIGRYEPESETLQEPTDQVAAAAQGAYLNPDLILNGHRYVLTAVLTPQGTTTNGFVTLYAIPDQETPDLYLGVDPRRTELLVFRRSGATGG